jgi:hypothetical protein
MKITYYIPLFALFLVFSACDDDSGNNNNVNNTNNTNVNNVNNVNNSNNINNLNNVNNVNNINNLNNLNNVDPCLNITCSGHGTCLVDPVTDTAYCSCNQGYEVEGLNCLISTDPCAGINCSDHGTCTPLNDLPTCVCENGFAVAGVAGLECVPSAGVSVCTGVICSNNGTCREWTEASGAVAVCECNSGYTPSGSHGLDCVPTSDVCTGGIIDYDYDDDGTNNTWFDPSVEECSMFEAVNRTRATHDHEGQPECHRPLLYDVLWSAHGRHHSQDMADAGSLFHEDYPGGQNCAMGYSSAEAAMGGYMTGPSEPHCPDLSHHCNIMRCTFSWIGVGYANGYTWNTQNFH